MKQNKPYTLLDFINDMLGILGPLSAAGAIIIFFISVLAINNPQIKAVLLAIQNELFRFFV